MGASTDRTNCAGGRPQRARSAEPFQLPRRGAGRLSGRQRVYRSAVAWRRL